MRINYDKIAAEYSQHRAVHPGVLRNLLEQGNPSIDKTVLEVGCGTGNYILALCTASGCRGWGIDPSAAMLSFARERGSGIRFQQGNAENLLFSENTFDLVFSVDVIHHVSDRANFIREALRVLKPGGKLCTVTDDETLIRTRVPLASYFPETVECELARYPRREHLVDWMEAAGFNQIQPVIVRYPYELRDIRAYEDKAFSSLHLISEAAFEAGIARMRSDLEKAPIPAVSHYLLLWGEVPQKPGFSSIHKIC